MQNGHKDMQVRCVVTDSHGNTVTSDTVTITVPTAHTELAITSQPTNFTWASGQTASFHVVATGDELTYQWQVKFAGNANFTSSGAASAKTDTYSFTMQSAHKNMEVRCIVTDKYGNTVTYDAVTITAATPLAIPAQPTDFAWANGQTASFHVEATGDALT